MKQIENTNLDRRSFWPDDEADKSERNANVGGAMAGRVRTLRVATRGANLPKNRIVSLIITSFKTIMLLII